MRFSLLTSAFTGVLTTQVLTAPTPDALQLTLRINAKEPATEARTVNLRFAGATPSAFYDLQATVDGKQFQIKKSRISSILILTVDPSAKKFQTTHWS